MKASGKYIVPVFLVAILVLAPRVSLGLLIDFESFNSGDNPSGGGVTFTNATVLTAGVSLNQLEFPPHSGVNVAIDDGGPMIITFSTPFDKVSGFFTHLESITLLAFDGPDGTGNQIGMVTSAFSENFVSSGNPPNEMLMTARPVRRFIRLGRSERSQPGADPGTGDDRSARQRPGWPVREQTAQVA